MLVPIIAHFKLSFALSDQLLPCCFDLLYKLIHTLVDEYIMCLCSLSRVDLNVEPPNSIMQDLLLELIEFNCSYSLVPLPSVIEKVNEEANHLQ
jgi:hypothetical protein